MSRGDLLVVSSDQFNYFVLRFVDQASIADNFDILADGTILVYKNMYWQSIASDPKWKGGSSMPLELIWRRNQKR